MPKKEKSPGEDQTALWGAPDFGGKSLLSETTLCPTHQVGPTTRRHMRPSPQQVSAGEGGTPGGTLS
jgi:hypothetical protein